MECSSSLFLFFYHNKQLRLQDTIDEVQQQATAEGAFGRGTSRYLEAARPDVQLPDGAAWSTVRVK